MIISDVYCDKLCQIYEHHLKCSQLESFQTAPIVSACHVIKALAAFDPTGGSTQGIVDSADFSTSVEKGQNVTLTRAGLRHKTVSYWLPTSPYLFMCASCWPHKDLKPEEEREVKGPIGSGHGHMTRPQAIPKTAAHFSMQQCAVARPQRTVNEKLSREEKPALFRSGGINRIPIKRCTIWNMRRD